MAISATSIQGNGVAKYYEFVADKQSDVASLPGLEKCAPGSTCFVIENSSVWMMKTDGVWKEI